MKKRILVTGESGFIGSHLIDHLVKSYPDYEIHGLDCNTYAANRENTIHLTRSDNYHFMDLDIRERDTLMQLFEHWKYTDVIHLAAESHVDNSIENPLIFAETNIIGTINLLDAFRKYSKGRFHHVSTDEVYGDLTNFDWPFEESTPYNPSSPYSASKAASDHFVRAYHRTYGIDITISNCSNNFGPHQHSEKLIPTVIKCYCEDNFIGVYGDGKNIRDWLYVKDHVKAIDTIFHKGNSGETYNIGGDMELTNIDLIKYIGDICNQRGYTNGGYEDLISFVPDRAGHDARYAIDCTKIKNQLGWKPDVSGFKANLLETVDYYAEYILKQIENKDSNLYKKAK